MPNLSAIGEMIAVRRRSLNLSQSALAKQAKIGLSTLDALENGRMGELGYSKILRVLAVLGLELRVEETVGRRPTLDELMEEHSSHSEQQHTLAHGKRITAPG
jgi:transcriptional regulator with XRE-family HTH domain